MIEFFNVHKVFLVFKKEQDVHDRRRHDGQDKFREITKAILGCCFDVINTLGSGFVESVYRNALWNIEEYIILRIMPPAIMHILLLFEE